MFCKWCGETITTAAERCPKCGRETPAMSDCGGFYQLKTGGENSAVPPQPSGPIKLPQLDKLGHMYVRDMKKTRLLQLVSLGAMVLTVLLLVVTLISIVGVGARLSVQQPDGDSQHQEDSENPQQGSLPGDEELTQPTEPPVPVLSEQNVVLSMKLYNGEKNKGYVQAGIDLGECEQETAAWAHTEYGDESGKRRSWIVYDLGEGTGLLNLREYDIFTEDGLEAGLSWETQGVYFGALKAQKYVWECSAGDGGWEEITSGAVEDDAGEVVLKLPQESLGKEAQQLRCTVTFRHSDGGTMTIVLEGLLFNEDGICLNGPAPFAAVSVTEDPRDDAVVVE